MYDITNKFTFDNIPNWIEEVEKHASTAVKILVGNKCDCESERVVDSNTAKEFAQKNGLLFLETSAKDSTNVPQAFQSVAEVILETSHIESAQPESNF